METKDRLAIDDALDTLISSDLPQIEAAEVIIGYRASWGKLSQLRISNGEWSTGGKKGRVGSYRIWNAGSDLFCREIISFHHFWKSSTATGNSNPERYDLGYNRKTLEPIYFGMDVQTHSPSPLALVRGEILYTA